MKSTLKMRNLNPYHPIAFRKRAVAMIVMLLACLVGSVAQPMPPQPPHKEGKGGFNPQKFQADLEQYITVHAGLTPGEAAKFFPVYRQMGKKMRMLFDEMRRWHQFTPRDNEKCADAIRRQDELDIQLKQLQQEYHARFMMLLPAKKVLEIIKAEEQFHRDAFRKMKK